jgi:predicted outer membrane repeat protein
MLTNVIIISNTSQGSTYVGGGIYSEAPLTLTNVTIAHNAAASSGGGVYVNNSLSLSGGKFENNACANLTCDGGGLWATTVSMSGTQFLTNTAMRRGGGLFAASSITLTGGLFRYNRIITDATLSLGGGLYVDAPTFLSGTQFISNQVGNSGGAIYIGTSNGILTATNVSVLSNTAPTCGGVYVANFLSATNMLLEGNTSSKNDGGGACAATGAFFANSAIQNNSTTATTTIGYGGGLYILGSLTAINTTFISNTAVSNDSRGGGAYVAGNTVLTDVIIQTNRCTGAGCSGGGFYSIGNIIALTNTRVQSNTSLIEGGGIFQNAGGGGVFKIENSQFQNNRAGRSGGGVWTQDTLVVTNTQFYTNAALEFHGGGAYAVTLALLTNARFERNYAASQGGGIYALLPVTATNTVFISNTAAEGGGLYSTRPGAFISSTFQQNSVTGAGGGAFVGDATVINTQFLTNTASADGGGLRSSHTIVADSSFQNNTGSFGGALRAAGTLALTNTQILSNTATGGDSGGIRIDGGGSITGGLFVNNRCLGGSCVGGGLLSFASVNPLVIANSQFISNSANGGGGGLTADNQITATNLTITRNSIQTTGSFGGGGLLATARLALFSSVVISNTSGTRGGGVYVAGAGAIVGSQIIQNSSADGGGGVYAKQTLNISDTLITANRCTASACIGGGAYIQEFFNISNTQFIANYSEGDGGGLYHFAVDGQMANTLLARNRTKSGNGNAIFFRFVTSQGHVQLFYTTIATPTGIVSGSAIYLGGTGNVTVVNTIITSHTVGIDKEVSSIQPVVYENFNLFFGNTADRPLFAAGVNSLNGNPAFTDPAADIYTLASNSAAVNAGTDAGIYNDFENDARPRSNGFDIGYDESPHAIPYDLLIAKTASTNIAVPGQSVTFTLVFKNVGANPVTSITISDVLPITLTNIVSTSSGVNVTPTLNGWQVQDLISGTVGYITVTGVIKTNLITSTTLVNSALITYTQLPTQTEGTPSNNSALAQINVIFPTIAFAHNTYGVAESAGAGAFGVVASPQPYMTVTVNYSTTNGTASSGSDYTGKTGVITFTPGVTLTNISIPILTDSLDEYNETFQISLTNPISSVLGTAAVATIVITDDNAAPTVQFTAASINVNESAVSVTLTATLSAASARALSAAYATSGLTAQSNVDYTSTIGILTFPAFSTTQTFTVGIINDLIYELPEQFTVQLSQTGTDTPLIGSPSIITVTILDNDTPPSITISNTASNEGNSGAANLVFTVTLAPASGITAVVNYNTADGTATVADSDYTAQTSSLTFAPGVTQQFITILANGDTTYENNETVFVNLTAATSATLVISQATGTIVNDDAPPSFSINSVTVTEGTGGTTYAVFTVTLTGATALTATVDYASADNTTTAPFDYTPVTGTLSFPVGVTTRLLTVSIATDSGKEPTETFAINLSNPTNATIGVSQGSGAIIDDDVNIAPLAVTNSSKTVLVGSSVTLSGTASNDPDGNYPLIYRWTQTGGAGVILSNANISVTTFTAPLTPTVLTFQLVVTDSGIPNVPSNPATIIITVTDFSISSLNVTSSGPTLLGNATFFTATIVTGTNVVYVWNFGDSAIVSDSATISHTYATTRTFTVVVTATNAANSQSASVTTTVHLKPIANAGPDQTVIVSTTVRLSGTLSYDPEGYALAYRWTQTSGPAVALSSATAVTPTFTAPATPTVLRFSLAVTDALGAASVADSVTITVTDEAISGLQITVNGQTVKDTPISFTISASAGTNIILTARFGDGATYPRIPARADTDAAVSGEATATIAAAGSFTLTHTYTSLGVYTITVTGTNSINTVTASKIITITAGQQYVYLPLVVR